MPQFLANLGHPSLGKTGHVDKRITLKYLFLFDMVEVPCAEILPNVG